MIIKRFSFSMQFKSVHVVLNYINMTFKVDVRINY